MTVIGISITYISATLVVLKFNEFTYRWYHLIGVFLLIGAMNNGNIRRETPKSADFASTYLFLGTIIMAILMFWII
jgi:hypothetical protein